MTSTKEKGRQYQNEAMEIFEKQGWTVWKPGNKARFIGPGRVVSQSQDILECADFVAVKKHGPVYFVQVKTEGEKATTSDARKGMQKIDTVPFNLRHAELVVMARIHGKVAFRVWTKWPDESWSEIEQSELERRLDAKELVLSC